MLKKNCIAGLFIISLFAFTGCEMAHEAVQDKPIEYSGSKVRVIVDNVKNSVKSDEHDKIDSESEVIKEQLITALANTNVFAVVNDNSANLQNVQYRIEAVITEYEANEVCVNKTADPCSNKYNASSNIICSTMNTISSGLNSIVDVFNFKKNYIAMSIHLIDYNTGDTVNSQRIEANPKDYNGSRLNINGGIKTPIQKATWACVHKASRWAANKVISNNKHSKNTSALSKNTL